ncbi:YsnF/AvaK domain-containing protein [Granulicoccus sp. GXG6511]|uniref:YsnF/AvaK domain-containing protein n=1 Tax=Granulicoccus sp. GXG6511 TaxID=3381351 RepID=UPI003D7EF99E
MTNAEFERIANATAYSPSGDKLGKVGQLYLDDKTNQPSFVSVKTGLLGLSESLVPMQGHSWNGEDLVLPFEKDIVKDAPNVDADRHLSESEQDELFAYYAGLQGSDGTGRPRPTAAGTVGAGVGTHDRSGFDAGADRGADRGFDHDRGADLDHDRGADLDHDRGADLDYDRGADTIRREEHMNVGTETHETGRARLRKYTTTEDESVTVPVTKEKVVVDREPVEGRSSGGIDTDRDGTVEEITTREERPVVEKETVDKERVSLGKETVTEDRTVTDQVRKEHIDVDTEGDVDNRRR